jgi:hypothetical protein
MVARRGTWWRISPAVAAGPILDPRLASPHYPGPSAPTSKRRGWPKSPGHGEPPCGRTLARCHGGRNGQCGPTCARLAAWRGREGRGAQGGAVDAIRLARARWWARASSSEWAAAMVARFSAQREQEGGRDKVKARDDVVALLRLSRLDRWAHDRCMDTTARPHGGNGLWPVGHRA